MNYTVTAIPAKLLVSSHLAPNCRFEFRVERDPTSEEWDEILEVISILRRQADRQRPTPATVPASSPQTSRDATPVEGKAK